MHARRFGRWVGRAAVIAAFALGSVAAGSVAQADIIWERVKPAPPSNSAPAVADSPQSAD